LYFMPVRCKRCVMDSTDPNIKFDSNGICNHCHEYDKYATKYSQFDEKYVLNLIKKIKSNRVGDYDCAIGVSGGLDSSYLVYKTVELGLNPIIYHIDNEYDTNEAKENIRRIVNSLGLDYYVYNVDWDLYKEIELSFLKSSTPDLEVPTDHANYAIQFISIKKFNTKFILTGNNYKTESHQPFAWSSPGAKDWIYIKQIQERFGSLDPSTFPHTHPLTFLKRSVFNKGTRIPLLNYLNYDANSALEELKKEFGYKYYGLKHHESIITRFLQTYILPEKFGIDKRKSHLSSLICSGFITRDSALEILDDPPLTENQIAKDKKYVLKRLELDEGEFEELMNLPNKSYWDYPHFWLFDLYKYQNARLLWINFFK